MRVQTERLRLEILDSIGRAKELARKVDDPTFRRRPEGDAWSAAECIDHLNVSTESFVRKIRRAVEGGKVRPGRDHEDLTLFGRIYLWLMEPPVRKRLPSPQNYVPAATTPPREVLLVRFERAHRELIQLIEETDAIDRGRLKLPSPVSKWIRISLLDAFAVLAAHDRRHLWQAERACGPREAL